MVFAGLSRAATSFFYATEQNKKAYGMIYGENIALFSLLIIIPPMIGITGTWLCIMISQVLIALMGQAMIQRERKS